jgi:putative endopeptidase
MPRIARPFAVASFLLAVAVPATAQNSYIQTLPLDPANIDRTANACVDFYQFANGGWIKNNPIPPAFSRWGSFDELGEKNQAALTKILDKATANADAKQAAAAKMLGTYYSSCMDSAVAEKLGGDPLRPRLARFDAV